MQQLRKWTDSYRRLTLLVAVLALAVKALLPAGFMLAQHSTVLTVLICSDAVSSGQVGHIAIDVGVEPVGTASKHDKTGGSCPYAGLAMTSLAGAPVLALGLALAFLLALAFAPLLASRPAAILRLRPPLRGPPFSGFLRPA